MKRHDGDTLFVKLDLSRDAQRMRIMNVDRANFGKLRDIEILEANFDQFEASIATMPQPDLVINTETTTPDAAAEQVITLLNA